MTDHDSESTCPFARELVPEAYVNGELSGVEREVFERHLFMCSECSSAAKIGSYIVGCLKELK